MITRSLIFCSLLLLSLSSCIKDDKCNTDNSTHLSGSANGAGTNRIAYFYDGQGNLIKDVMDNHTSDYQYANGHLVSKTTNDTTGRSIETELRDYDAQGRLTRITLDGFGQAMNENYTYNGNTVTVTNGTNVHIYEMDANGDPLTEQTFTKQNGSSELLTTITNTFDNNINPLKAVSPNDPTVASHNLLKSVQVSVYSTVPFETNYTYVYKANGCPTMRTEIPQGDVSPDPSFRQRIYVYGCK